ncbi:SDR family NAD(P)-dependent oxidoreductase [Amycolatopsis saalfeldensis]|uniref:NAD(P)-dependent dehydrogenase, short-chain alcohol dehydrogenase family n=1 Tax=Amycolatopsis saalfeldensis TaxID=394193 RepID=A0A1H8RRC1_9PSEU|nr:SDR family NAD(P)-dependent oxidoreductase [Amycolatopsis saalfeldensis]SEO68902.1 NAD(P)-dependent dehydrogenase, short-chain alcohol dehydrogenase family [Amycolatopsis saalfeldensis]
MSAADVPIDLSGRIALVTGGTGGMGRVITTELARAGAHVVTTSRDPVQGDALRRRVATDVGADRVEVLTGDLASRADLLRLAAEFAARHDALHLLVNNAGAHYRNRWLTVDGVEAHVAVNHLAGFGLTYLLRDRLRADPPARVVNVVSAAMSNIRPPLFGRPRPVPLDLSGVADVRELNPAEGFAPFAAYARAKLLATVCGYEFADRWRDEGVTVNAVHPGIVSTGIVDDILPTVLGPFRSLIHRRLLTPEQGASAALRLATDPSLATASGRYYVRDQEKRSPDVSYDPVTRAAAWQLSLEWVTTPGRS